MIKQRPDPRVPGAASLLSDVHLLLGRKGFCSPHFLPKTVSHRIMLGVEVARRGHSCPVSQVHPLTRVRIPVSHVLLVDGTSTIGLCHVTYSVSSHCFSPAFFYTPGAGCTGQKERASSSPRLQRCPGPQTAGQGSNHHIYPEATSEQKPNKGRPRPAPSQLIDQAGPRGRALRAHISPSPTGWLSPHTV